MAGWLLQRFEYHGLTALHIEAMDDLFKKDVAFFHNNFADQNQVIHFVKNLAIAGGLLQVGVAGAGRLSLDARRLQQA